MSWTRPVSVLLAALIAAGAPLSAAADPVKSYPAATRLSSSIAAKVGALKPSARALAQTATAPDSSGSAESGRSFFSTPTGVAAIVLMVAGVAYVAYKIPKDNGKVHSPIR
jgi:CBS-domain-containing membrane protein